ALAEAAVQGGDVAAGARGRDSLDREVEQRERAADPPRAGAVAAAEEREHGGDGVGEREAGGHRRERGPALPGEHGRGPGEYAGVTERERGEQPARDRTGRGRARRGRGLRSGHTTRVPHAARGSASVRLRRWQVAGPRALRHAQAGVHAAAKGGICGTGMFAAQVVALTLSLTFAAGPGGPAPASGRLARRGEAAPVLSPDAQ